ncbi:MAG: proteasome subunit alpha, partial [Caldisphaera sp.]|nr:proteasome subunit alpha [Caldisphaera sp.]
AVKALFKSRIATSDEKKEELINAFGSYVEIAYIDTKQKVFSRVSEKEINGIALNNKNELLS